MKTKEKTAYVEYMTAEEAEKIIRLQYGDKPTAYEVAEFINAYWNEITGLPDEVKDEDGLFPERVETIVNSFLSVDLIDFYNAWIVVRKEEKV